MGYGVRGRATSGAVGRGASHVPAKAATCDHQPATDVPDRGPAALCDDGQPSARGTPVDHEPVLIATIAVGLSLAFVLGMVARRLRLPDPWSATSLAGVLIGPYTIGYRGGRGHRDRAGRDRRDPAHVRRRHPFLDRGPAGGTGGGGTGCPGSDPDRDHHGTAVGHRCSAGGSSVVSCWVCRSRSPARSCCCGRSSSGESWTPSRVASPWAGSSSRTCSRSWCWCCCRASRRSSAAPVTRIASLLGPLGDLVVALVGAGAFAAIVLVLGTRHRTARPRYRCARTVAGAVRAGGPDARAGCLLPGPCGLRRDRSPLAASSPARWSATRT